MTGPEPSAQSAPTRRITPRMKLAIASLAKGNSITEAALDAGVRSRSTLYRWLDWPEFQQALEQHTRDRSDAVSAVRELVRSSEVPPLVRLKAALALSGMTTEPERDGFAYNGRDNAIARTILPIEPARSTG